MNLEIITVAVKASELETDDLCFFYSVRVLLKIVFQCFNFRLSLHSDLKKNNILNSFFSSIASDLKLKRTCIKWSVQFLGL